MSQTLIVGLGKKTTYDPITIGIGVTPMVNKNLYWISKGDIFFSFESEASAWGVTLDSCFAIGLCIPLFVLPFVS